jgi:hypothetical protein
MKILNQTRLMSLIGVLVLFSTSMSAHALGTLAGVTISNTATIDYSVGGVGQTGIESAPAGNSTPGVGNGTPTDFIVDNKVIVTVAEVSDGAAPATPGQAAPPPVGTEVLLFTVTNSGNETQDYELVASNLAAAQTAPFTAPVTDDSDVTAPFTMYIDSDSSGDYSAGDAAIPTSGGVYYLDEMTPDETRNVLVVAAIPGTLVDGNVAVVSLVAITRDGNGAAAMGAVTTNDDATADNPAAIDVVFADAAGTDDATGARDGQHSDRDAFVMASAQISIQKTAATLWWNPAGTGNPTVANPKAIPGAYVQYTVVISNAAAAAASATLTTITDALAATLAIDPDLIVAGTGNPTNAAGDGFSVTYTTATARAGAGVASYYTTANDADGVEHNAGTITATMTTVLPADAPNSYVAGELKPGDTVTLVFNAIVQ